MDLDLAARKVIMASMAYYGLDEPIMPDSEFDELCALCASGWEELSAQRRFCLGSPELIRASGYHVRVTTLAEGAVALRMEPRRIVRTSKQRYDPVVGRWTPCTDYSWG